MKKYTSPSDIAEMKARGFEPQTIEAEEEKGLRWHAAERVREMIREAFKGVKLGNRTGLKEANGLDDYADQIKLAALRATDEKEDWRSISIDDLNQFQWGFSYFNPEGMRFHLPAFMIIDLNGDFRFDITSSLTNLSEYSISRFSLLSLQQRMAVRDYLVFIAEEESDYSFPKILHAPEEYWTDQSD